MLHILWILIKFILIILGILLGLALLAVLLLLFCPLRYQAQAVKESDSFKETEIEARVSWLFHAAGVRLSYYNGERKLEIMIFGVSLENIKGWFKKLKGDKGKKSGRRSVPGQAKGQKKSAQAEPELSMPEDEQAEQQLQEDNQAELELSAPEPEQPMQVESELSMPEPEQVAQPIQKDVPVEPKQPAQDENENAESAARPGLFTRIREILSKTIKISGKLWNKLTSLIKGIIKKIKHVKKTISGITDKIGWWRAFLTNERTKAAFSLIWKDAKGLIHHILPTKVDGHVTFGCEDPSVTGAALAVLGMSFPFHKNRIQITPLFDGENTLTGNVFLKGRIYGVMFVKAAIEIYFNKNIKYVINRWKHKED